MKAVIQRVNSACVDIESKAYSSIEKGMLILLGVGIEDNDEDINWLIGKIAQLRIFEDQEGVMNLSIKDINGEILVVSQFTLMARVKKGNRPSYIDAAKPEISIPMYEQFVKLLQKEISKEIKTGVFGANMQVKLINDGPVTIIIDSKNRI